MTREESDWMYDFSLRVARSFLSPESKRVRTEDEEHRGRHLSGENGETSVVSRIRSNLLQQGGG